MEKNNLAIILSGGTGKRFDKSKPKQFYKLNKKTIIETIPGWAHNIKNTGKKDLICILWSNEIYNENKPDTVYLKIN